MTALIEVRDVVAGYGRVDILEGFNLFVDAGEVVALIGPNAAGKTTALLTVAGVLKPRSGQILMDGAPAGKKLGSRARGGLRLVADDRSIFRTLTVRENLRLGGVSVADVVALFPALDRLLDRRAGLLSGGEQQMLALGRALAARPRILLVDELSLGLAPIVVRMLLAAVRRAADEGTGVLLVEQHARLALETADRAYVLQRGQIVITEQASELRKDFERVTESYLSVPSHAADPGHVGPDADQSTRTSRQNRNTQEGNEP